MKTLFLLPLSVSVCAAAAPTFYQDVMPVMQRNCQSCHRPGEVAPMSFLTYESTRPWAKAIKEAVVLKKMPPWFADPAVGHFLNDRTLSKSDKDTLVAWADAGAPAGNKKDAPKPVEFTEGWNIGKPDVVFEMQEDFEVPATGTVEYQYFTVPTGFTEDKWVQVVELRPGNAAVVHHAATFVRQPKPGEPAGKPMGQRASDELLDFHLPGGVPHILPPGQAKLIKAGSDLVFQIHYTATGKPARDRTRIGLIFAKEPPKERIYTLSVVNNRFLIPAGDDNFVVEAKLTLPLNARIVALNPHMHLRGKSFEFRVVPPGGEAQVLLRVPHYDFSWQLQYYLAEPLEIAAGTRIECTAHYDNSANNPFNPDATKPVHWGDQSWDEMMIGTVDVAIDPAANLQMMGRSRRSAAGN